MPYKQVNIEKIHIVRKISGRLLLAKKYAPFTKVDFGNFATDLDGLTGSEVKRSPFCGIFVPKNLK